MPIRDFVLIKFILVSRFSVGINNENVSRTSENIVENKNNDLCEDLNEDGDDDTKVYTNRTREG